MNVKLSVIIPAFNAASTIRGCLASILDGSVDGIEVIVVDDGSSDGTATLCRGIGSPCIKVLQQQNRGVSCARNLGLEAACGEYVMFVDADDLLCPGWFGTVCPCLDGADEIVYFGSSYIREHYGLDQFVGSVVGIFPRIAMKPETMPIRWASSPFSRIYLRRFLKTEGLGFDSRIINGEDALFNLEAFLGARRTRFVCKSIYRYRIHGGSATHSFDVRFFDSNEAFLCKLQGLMEERSSYTDVEISRMVDFSFCRSIEIMALRVAWIRDRRERRRAVEDVLSSHVVGERFAGRARISDNPLHERVVYRLAERGHFGLAVNLLRLALCIKGRDGSKERWVNI